MAYNGDTFTIVFLCEHVQLALMVSPRIATVICNLKIRFSSRKENKKYDFLKKCFNNFDQICWVYSTIETEQYDTIFFPPEYFLKIKITLLPISCNTGHRKKVFWSLKPKRYAADYRKLSINQPSVSRVIRNETD